VVLIHLQVPCGPDLHIKKAVPGKGGEHMGQKTNGVIQNSLSPAIQIHPDPNIRFLCFPADFPDSSHMSSF
jgi:hypothetical protein